MNEIKMVLDKVTNALSDVVGINAIVLGGSRARGNPSSSSDIDIGIYYDAVALKIDELNSVCEVLDDKHRENLIASPGEWGEWQNGGAWLTIDGFSVDFILRDAVKVKQVVEQCRNGIASPYYQTGHPHAFVSSMYMGELAVCKMLWEKDSDISCLKNQAERYPEKLREQLIRLFSFEADFSLWLAEDSIHKDDNYYVSAHLVRSVSALNQVLFALNKEYCLNEKKAVKMIDSFCNRPVNYKARTDKIFAAAGTDNIVACTQLRQLIDEAKSLLNIEETKHVISTISALSDSKGKQ